MGKNTFGKFLCVPLILIALPVLIIGLLIRFGFFNTLKILEKFNAILKELNHD